VERTTTVQREMLGFPTYQLNVVLELELELAQLLFSFQMVTDYHKFDLSDIQDKCYSWRKLGNWK
jgi:hypothetical protein